MCEIVVLPLGRCSSQRFSHKRARGNKGCRASTFVFVAELVMVTSCHALPWRETDTHSSFAVKADLPGCGAHDD